MRKYIAEFIGTFVLVTFGCGSAVAANSIFLSMGSPLPIAFTTLLIAVAFGLSIVAMAYSIGNISGCHVNPAVSLGMLITKRMDVKDFIGYVVAQFSGAAVGAMFLWLCFGAKDSLGQNGYGTASTLGINMNIAIVVEIVLTCVFVLVILAVTSKKEYSSVAGLVIGLTLTLIHIFGIPFTGTSVNPARSFGPAIFVGEDAIKQLPVFIIAPLVGAALAAVLFILLFEKVEEKRECDKSEDEENCQMIEETDETSEIPVEKQEETAEASEEQEEKEDKVEETAKANEEGAEADEDAAEDIEEAETSEESEDEPESDNLQDSQAEESPDENSHEEKSK